MNVYIGGGVLLLFMIVVTIVLIGQSKRIAKIQGAQKVIVDNG